MNGHGFGKLALPLVLLAACAQPKWIPGAPTTPPLPERVYEQAARDGEAVYRVDPQQSRVFVRTGRDGPMKSAGHDHVITSADIEGLVLLSVDPEESRADLRLPLQLLMVDDPAYRAMFGLEPEIPRSAIDGTTRNMQEKVLESNLFPWAVVSVRALSIRQEGQAELGVRVALHGTTFDYRVPAALKVDSGKLGVTGSMTVHHADLGLTPFSAAGGLLRVAENIEVVFDLVAIRGLDVSPESGSGPNEIKKTGTAAEASLFVPAGIGRLTWGALPHRNQWPQNHGNQAVTVMTNSATPTGAPMFWH